MSVNSLIQQIDELLPQTQCGECSYKGCLPYAKAIVEKNEMINRCTPGGVQTLKRIGDLLQQETSAFIAEMQDKTKPATIAKVREAECIGCTKCIQACPVDAIIGGAKQLHTVLEVECTGCGLCVPPCPVDCIDMTIVESLEYDPKIAKNRYEARNERLIKNHFEKSVDKLSLDSKEALEKKSYIEEALARAQAKKQKIL